MKTSLDSKQYSNVMYDTNYLMFLICFKLKCNLVNDFQNWKVTDLLKLI